MLETGVHFGHQTRRWNPKMRPFIFGARNGIHIIDLQQTVKLYRSAHDKIVETVAKGGRILFVGTKRQAQEAIATEAIRAGQFYVANRWMGGTLTNFTTIQKSIERLKKLESMFADGSVNRYQKKEILMLQREMNKLELTLGGIKNMEKLPQLIFIIDPHKENIAVQEGRKLGIPIMAVTDTNCDPDLIDYIIPGNDDAIRAIKLFVTAMAEACLEGEAMRKDSKSKNPEEELKKAAVAEVSINEEIITQNQGSISSEVSEVQEIIKTEDVQQAIQPEEIQKTIQTEVENIVEDNIVTITDESEQVIA